MIHKHNLYKNNCIAYIFGNPISSIVIFQLSRVKLFHHYRQNGNIMNKCFEEDVVKVVYTDKIKGQKFLFCPANLGVSYNNMIGSFDSCYTPSQNGICAPH